MPSYAWRSASDLYQFKQADVSSARHLFQTLTAMRPLEVLPKVGLYALPMQFALVCMAFLIRENASEQGARLILVSWLPGLVAFLSGIVATFSTRRFRWLGLSFAAFVVWCASVVFFAGFGL